MRKIDSIFIHCSASPNKKAKSLDQLRAEHKARGFSDIGYHAVIQPNGAIMPGRPDHIQGAHVEGHNKNSLGVCMIGTDKFTIEQWASLAAYVKGKMRQYSAIKRVRGHRDISPDRNGDGKISPDEWVKLCPSFSVDEWMAGGMQPLKGHIA